jgi:DNA-directed RNA polymerase specialized sigma subunit
MGRNDAAYNFYIRARDLLREINADKSELQALREYAVVQQYGAAPSGSAGVTGGLNDKSKVENAVLKIVQKESDISEKIEHYKLVREEIKATIEKLTDLNERTVLALRYLFFKRFEDIVVMTGYSKTSVFRMHQNGLKHTIITGE